MRTWHWERTKPLLSRLLAHREPDFQAALKLCLCLPESERLALLGEALLHLERKRRMRDVAYVAGAIVFPPLILIVPTLVGQPHKNVRSLQQVLRDDVLVTDSTASADTLLRLMGQLEKPFPDVAAACWTGARPLLPRLSDGAAVALSWGAVQALQKVALAYCADPQNEDRLPATEEDIIAIALILSQRSDPRSLQVLNALASNPFRERLRLVGRELLGRGGR